MSIAVRWTLAEIGRLMLTHQLATAPVAGALGLDEPTVEALVAEGIMPVGTDRVDPQVAMLVLNVLVRIEARCGGDSVAMRHSLTRPIDALGGASIADALAAWLDIDGLHLLREAAGTIGVPRVRMWRCPDQYS